MSDLRLGWSADGGDLVLTGGDLELDEGLVTAILVSLFTDARREEDPGLPTAAQDLRGWWGDETGGQFGSLLWLLDREKLTTSTVERAREYAKAALTWLVDEGIAASIDVQASVDGGLLALSIVIVRGTSRRFASLWRATDGVQLRAGDTFLDLALA